MPIGRECTNAPHSPCAYTLEYPFVVFWAVRRGVTYCTNFNSRDVSNDRSPNRVSRSNDGNKLRVQQVLTRLACLPVFL
jgi:hypothetical protein